MSLTCLRAALVLPALLGVAGCEQRSAGYFQGYAEGEFVMISPASAGRLEKRWVKRGDEVPAGAPLFALELENEKAGRCEAEARLKNAEAKLANLTTGRRAFEVDAVRAQEAQAKAARALKVGQAVNVACDGCSGAFAASISYVSHQAEYTPPVIYSREQRSKLVFLVEARPAPGDAARLHPGQPVEVTLK